MISNDLKPHPTYSTFDQIQIDPKKGHRHDNLEKVIQEFHANAKKTPSHESGSKHFHNITELFYESIYNQLKQKEQIKKELEKREEDLKPYPWLCLPASLSPAMRRLIFLNGTAKILAITSAGISIFMTENTLIRGIGFGVFALAEAFDGGASVYDSKIQIEQVEINESKRENESELDKLIRLEKFFKKLSRANSELEKRRENYQNSQKSPLMHRSVSHLDTTDDSSSDLDEKIKDCLTEYEELPKNCRDVNAQCFIISQLIQGLPENHPLRVGLQQLEPVEPDTRIARSAQHPLTVSYLPRPQHPTRSHSSETQSGEWEAEEAGTSQGVQQSTEPESTWDDYKEKISRYKLDVARHFGTSYFTPYFLTPNGWKVSTENGLEKLEESAEEINADIYSQGDEADQIPPTTNPLDPGPFYDVI